MKDLKYGDGLDVYVPYDIDEELEVLTNLVGLLEGPKCIDFSDKDDISNNSHEDRRLNPYLNANDIDLPNSESDGG